MTSMSGRLAGVTAAAALALLTAGALAQAPPAQPPQAAQPPPAGPQQPPIFRGGVNFVRVDAVVTDKNGAPVPGLKEDDFEISENGKRQKIASFQSVMLDGGLLLDPGDQAVISSDEVALQEAARD